MVLSKGKLAVTTLESCVRLPEHCYEVARAFWVVCGPSQRSPHSSLNASPCAFFCTPLLKLHEQ